MARYRLVKIAIVIMTLGAVVHAQPAPEHIRRGDEAYRVRKADEALVHFMRAIVLEPANYEAQWKASRAESDLAEAAGLSANKRLVESAELHAQAAVRLRPDLADGHFALVRALRLRSLDAGVRDRARFADAIRSEALAALQADPQHPGALHALGMWHAELMRVNGMSRKFALWFLGADLFESANWDDAQQLLEDAVRLDPGRIIHRLNLAGIYADRGDKTRARQMYASIASFPLVDPNDDLYKRQAAERLAKLGS